MTRVPYQIHNQSVYWIIYTLNLNVVKIVFLIIFKLHKTLFSVNTIEFHIR